MSIETPISGILVYKEDKFHCVKIGRGKKLLIGFHGVGSDAYCFLPLMPYLKEEYTLVSIDLPGHGATELKSKYFEPKALMAIIQGIKTEFQVEQFTLVGYSMGAKVCLKVIELQPDWVDRTILLAGDGLKKNFWYNFATKNIFGKRVFNHIVNKPSYLINLVKKMEKSKLIGKTKVSFVEKSLTNQVLRDRIRYVWPVMSKITPRTVIVKWGIKKYNIETHIVIGKYDPLFKVKDAESFALRQKNIHVHILEAGHFLLIDKFIPQIVKLFL